MALAKSVENPDAFRSDFTVSDAVVTLRSSRLCSVTLRRTPLRKRRSPENMPATSDALNPSMAPRRSGWNGTPTCAWTSSGNSIVWQNCR